MASIKQRGDSYLITVSLGRDVNGKKIFETVTYKPDTNLTPKRKQKAVEAFAASFEEQCKNGLTLDGRKITLQEFISIYNPGSRLGLIHALVEMRTYLDEDEQELRTLTDSAVYKLSRITDDAFEKLDLIPEF